MYKKNMGLIFHGTVGTGKSFLACCIANAVVERERPKYLNIPAVIVATLPALVSRLSATEFKDKEDFLKKIAAAELLVIDDFGSEYASEYILSQADTIFNTRYLSGKPLIVTTNLSIDQFNSPSDQHYNRIYDRIYQMCGNGAVFFGGDSRRTDIALEKQAEFNCIMESEN
jgi:DNA replication protein DnaC